MTGKITILIICWCAVAGAQLHYPETKKVDQVDNYFGTEVADPYRWLEDDTSAAVKEWVQQENAVTFAYLDKIPFRDSVKARLTKLLNYPKYSAPFREGDNWFFYKNDGLQNQSVLYMRRGSLTAEPEVFLDPNTFSEDGTVSLEDIEFNRTGRYCAYAISKAGSDWREIHVMDVNAKKILNDKLEWVKFSAISWLGNGFYYSRYDEPKDTSSKLTASNSFHKVYYHVVRTPQRKDALVYPTKKSMDRNDPDKLYWMVASDDNRIVYLYITKRGSNGNALYYRDIRRAMGFEPVLSTFDDDISVVNNIGSSLILKTNRHAPNGRVVLFDPKHPDEKDWQDILPEKKEPLDQASIVGRKLFAIYTKDVSHRVYVYDLKGNFENEIHLDALGTVSGLTGKWNEQFVFYTLTSFTYPSTIYKYDIKTEQSTLYKKTDIDFNPDDYLTRQVFYRSKDSTHIPMFIVYKKGIQLDGNNPTYLYGYGGFNISMMPNFSASRIAWLEQGGIYAMPNIRGGGEYGEKWHEAGMRLHKQNVFDDFIAAAKYLIKNKYTNPTKLVCSGASNGGLLIGAVINQRPDLFKVALPAVGVMDMLRFQKFTIGWAWVNDYGSSDDSVQFEYLYKYSPLQNISDTTRYPAVLVTTADHDDRVVPAHSFKYIATLQEKYKGLNPVLIRIETSAGHGYGKPLTKIIEEIADTYSFAWWNLGVTPVY